MATRSSRSVRRAPHRDEGHTGPLSARLNWLRAGVLGANDGIISTAGLVIGVAAATAERDTIATAGIAGLVAGAGSMAPGGDVSGSKQRDTGLAVVAEARREVEEVREAGCREREGGGGG